MLIVCLLSGETFNPLKLISQQSISNYFNRLHKLLILNVTEGAEQNNRCSPADSALNIFALNCSLILYTVINRGKPKTTAFKHINISNNTVSVSSGDMKDHRKFWGLKALIRYNNILRRI